MRISDLESMLMTEGLLVKPTGTDCAVSGVTYNSKAASKGGLFICKGAAFKREYLLEAVDRGAACYLADKDYDVLIPGVIVTDIRKAMALCACMFFGHPSKKLDLIGITGTKGKTTVSYMTKAVLQQAGRGYGLLSSIANDTGRRCEEAHLTTPESLDLQSMLDEMVRSGLVGGVMEVSSQGLQYDRVYGTVFSTGVFLNIGEDHISPIEHRDFDEYFSAKKRIFAYTDDAVINADDGCADEIIETARGNGCGIRTYGIRRDADVVAYNISREGRYTAFSVRTREFDRRFQIPLLGAFNVYNALAAICICMDRVDVQFMQKGLKKVHVPGRMEVFGDGEITVIIDYAHNKMSFETLFQSLRDEFPGHRLVSVYGCPGGKAFLRRKDLGTVSGRMADLSILTAEDPGYEDVDAISEEIAGHVKAAGGKAVSIADRAEAVERAIMDARAGDVIVITGKGDEPFQKCRGKYEPYDGDIVLTKRFLKAKAKKQ